MAELDAGDYEGQVTFRGGGTEWVMPVYLAFAGDHTHIIYLPVVMRAAP